MAGRALPDKLIVIPAKAGTHASAAPPFSSGSKALPKDPWFDAVGPWAPACAGVTCERATRDCQQLSLRSDDKVGDLGSFSPEAGLAACRRVPKGLFALPMLSETPILISRSRTLSSLNLEVWE